jgi:hypothetical protein
MAAHMASGEAAPAAEHIASCENGKLGGQPRKLGPG